MKLSWKKCSSLIGFVSVCAAYSASSAFADDLKVEVTSFDYVNNAGRVAEICGKVTGATAVTLVRVAVDVNTSSPGLYNVVAGKDGQFCTVAASYRGTVNVSVESLGKTAESGVVLAAHQR